MTEIMMIGIDLAKKHFQRTHPARTTDGSVFF